MGTDTRHTGQHVLTCLPPVTVRPVMPVMYEQGVWRSRGPRGITGVTGRELSDGHHGRDPPLSRVSLDR